MKIQVEITNVCNLNCIYCDRKSMGSFFSNGMRHMTYDEFDHILDQLLINKLEKKHFDFCGLSEPLISPYFLDLIRNHKFNIFKNVRLISNGMLLTEDLVHNIIKCHPNIGIRISLQSCNRGIMEYLQNGANFDKVLYNASHLLSHANELRWVEIQSLKCKYTENETIEDFERALKHKFEDKKIFNKRTGIDITGKNVHLDFPKGYTQCSRYGKHVVVNVFGDMTACCHDCTRLQSYGNIFDNPLRDILKSSIIDKRRRQISELDFDGLPLCRMCMLGKNK